MVLMKNFANGGTRERPKRSKKKTTRMREKECGGGPFSFAFLGLQKGRLIKGWQRKVPKGGERGLRKRKTEN